MFIKQRIKLFVKREGRRPRILVSNMGNKSHDHDTKLLATIFAESGFDVDISPLHQTPQGTARMAIENDVHAICFFSTANRHKNLVTDLVKVLKEEQTENIRIVLCGAIPRSDCASLYDAGADLILSSMPTDRTAVNRLLNLFE